MAADHKWLIVDVAALGWNLVSRYCDLLKDFEFRPLEPVFPALTCPVQAAIRTGLDPAAAGMPANGFFHPELQKVLFWEQSARLVRGDRIWRHARSKGRRIAMLFWQQSLGEDVDVLLSPKPVHKHHGGIIDDCYSWPTGLYAELVKRLGRPFRLRTYWGPLASTESSRWITDAIVELMNCESTTVDVIFAYLPHLDYDLQRFGPDSEQARRAVATLGDLLRRLRNAALAKGWEWLFWGDYAMEPAHHVIFPNRMLRQQGWLQVRHIRGRAYLDFYASKAFAVADHQIAHLYVKDAALLPEVLAAFEREVGVEKVISHGPEGPYDRSGQLILVARPHHWFAYPWWTESFEAPDYAAHVDIHNKPGYDPCELFWGWPPGSISQNPQRVRGTHGRVAPELFAAWTCSRKDFTSIASHTELARALAEYL